MGSGASSIGSELEDRSLDDNYRTLLLGLKDGENNKDLVALKEAFVRKEMKLKAVTVALKEALVRKEMKLNTVTGNLTSDATVDFDRVYVNEAKEIDPEVTSALNNIKVGVYIHSSILIIHFPSRTLLISVRSGWASIQYPSPRQSLTR